MRPGWEKKTNTPPPLQKNPIKNKKLRFFSKTSHKHQCPSTKYFISPQALQEENILELKPKKNKIDVYLSRSLKRKSKKGNIFSICNMSIKEKYSH